MLFERKSAMDRRYKPQREVKTMLEFLGIVLFVVLLVPLFRESKFKEIERHRAMRRAMLKLRDKYQRYSF
jgi:hypothetical protein